MTMMAPPLAWHLSCLDEEGWDVVEKQHLLCVTSWKKRRTNNLQSNLLFGAPLAQCDAMCLNTVHRVPCCAGNT